MGFFSSLFGKKETVPEVVLGQPVAPETLPAGGIFPNMMRINESFTTTPKATVVGIKRAKMYKGRTVVCGVVTAGSFNRDDNVIVTIDGAPVQAPILDVVPVGNMNFMDEVAANMHKHTVGEGATAWLILDLTVLPAVNTVVGKL
ncbi:MAG: hypothetical protein IJM57_02195 [Lachnospiraceae bacterium]|nr:hypothetical protein [Lachnospiraceae bacterium]